ncbi:MAG TPA: PEP/pyruvate-binding domain-containing protein [Polyangiaceae bacterium]|nr:PEP/pyruvate-binding domain-containing protein [Polyangiaceae bacterium]
MARTGRLRPKAVIPLTEAPAGARKDTQLGTLARSLASIERLGVVVPETYVVVADVFRHVVANALPPGHDPGSLLRTVRRPIGVERAARARERLLDVELPTEVEREIDAAYRNLSEIAPWGVAVRASALVPDGGAARLAGLSATELPLFDRDAVGDAIRRVWARAAAEPTLRYLRARKVREVALAVLLQPVVPALASLTLVTTARAIGASHGPKGEATIVALPGLHFEDADLAAAEIATFDERGELAVLRPLAATTGWVVRAGALRKDERSPALRDVSRMHAAELGEIVRRLESLGPVELRCVVPERGEITVVDCRPGSSLGFPGLGTAQTLWGRVAGGEASGLPLTPLSRDAEESALRLRVGRLLGDEGRAEDATASVDGRLVVDLSRVGRGVSAADVVDGADRAEIASAQWSPSESNRVHARISLARAGLRIAQLAAEQRVLTDDVSRFERDAETERRWLAEMDLAILPDDALTTTLHEVSGFLARANELHLRATLTAVSAHALLASMLSGVEPARAASLAHALSAGADVVSGRPSAALCHVAGIARLDEPGRAFLDGGPASLRGLPDGPLARALARFFEAFGDRGPSEAELSSPRWAEEPARVLAALATIVRAPAFDPEVALSRARAQADRELALLEPRLSFLEIRLVRDSLSRLRDVLRLRERCRVRVAHALTMLRVVSLDVDRRIRKLDPSLEAGDAFLLTLEELGSAVSKYRADLAPIVRGRREDLARDRRRAGPPPVFRGAPGSRLPLAPGGVIRAVPASGGAALGVAQRLDGTAASLARFVPGAIAVVENLDLGLAPLLVHAGGVVSELGTPFSSSAVVARDFGVPVVTSVPGAFVSFRDGDRVRVDGTAGTIESVP